MTDDRNTILRRTAAASLAGVFAFALAGCKSNNPQAAANGQDPAAANMAQPYTGTDAGNGQPTQVLGQEQSYAPQSSGQSYAPGRQAAAPIIRQAPAGSEPQQPAQDYYPVPQAQGSQVNYGANSGSSYDSNYNYNAPYTDQEAAGAEALDETEAQQAPPPLPVYDQPPAPEPNYLWTPGYWGYANAGYYWVPGAWVAPPYYGALWTPPYWGYYNNRYLYHHGYWGQHVGFYGGVNYGFGYIGTGYFGGYWHDRDFYYNRSVTNVNVTHITNVYNHTVIYNNRTYGPLPDNRVSYNGGRGGINVAPRPQEVAALHEAHYGPLPVQRELHVQAAANRSQFYSANGGRPAQAFVPHPVGARENIATAPPARPANNPSAFNRPGQPNQPAFNRPGQPGQPAFNNNNRPGQPGFNNGRPGAPVQPNVAASRPGEPIRPGAPNQPNLRPNQPTTQPANRYNQPSNEPANRYNQPSSEPANRYNEPANRYNQPQPNAQPANRYNQPEPANPPANRYEARPAQPQPQPQARPAQPQPQPRPAYENRPAQPQPETHPSYEQQQRPAYNPQPAARPAAPAPRPAPAPASHPAPAAHTEAPHGGGGGGHEDHKR